MTDPPDDTRDATAPAAEPVFGLSQQQVADEYKELTIYWQSNNNASYDPRTGEGAAGIMFSLVRPPREYAQHQAVYTSFLERAFEGSGEHNALERGEAFYRAVCCRWWRSTGWAEVAVGGT